VREETKRRLDALQGADRRWKWLAAAFGTAAVLAAWFWLVPTGQTRQVTATVRAAAVQHVPDTGQAYMWIESQLDNGKIVRASGAWAKLPERGARIVLTEHIGGLGFRGYSWHGIVDGQPPPPSRDANK